MMGFKAFHSAASTIAGIETAHMIRKGQTPTDSMSAFQKFGSLRHPERFATDHEKGPGARI